MAESKEVELHRTDAGEIVLGPDLPFWPEFFRHNCNDLVNKLYDGRRERPFRHDRALREKAHQARFRVGRRRDGTFLFDCSIARDPAASLMQILDEDEVRGRWDLRKSSLDEWATRVGAVEMEDRTESGKRRFFLSSYRTDKADSWVSSFTNNGILVPLGRAKRKRKASK